MIPNVKTNPFRTELWSTKWSVIFILLGVLAVVPVCSAQSPDEKGIDS